MSYVQILTPQDNLTAILQRTGKRLVVIDYSATWCGHCKKMAPFIHQLANLFHEEVTIYQCDIDLCPSIASQAQIHSTPTYHFYKDKKILAQLSGAEPEKLKSLILQYK